MLAAQMVCARGWGGRRLWWILKFYFRDHEMGRERAQYTEATDQAGLSRPPGGAWSDPEAWNDTEELQTEVAPLCLFSEGGHRPQAALAGGAAAC